LAEYWVVAAKAGLTALAIAYTQRALNLESHLPAAHESAEELYRSIGNLPAAKNRRTALDRLQNNLAKHKSAVGLHSDK
jgi:hypothetical protein